MEERKANFKKTFTKDEGSKKRIEYTTKLQKEKREKSISSKRSRREDEGEEVRATIFSPEEISQALQLLHNNDPNGLRALRKILSVEDPPIQEILQSPTQPLLSMISFLNSSNEVQQLDAAWCLTNIATGTHEQTASVLPAAPYLIQHLSGSNMALVEQCAWALGNLSADCVEYRDTLRANGILKPLVSILQRYANSAHQQHHHASPQSLSLVRTAAFALSNQARGQNAKLEDFMHLNIAPILVRILDTNEEMSLSDDTTEAPVPLTTEILIEVGWILTYLSTQVTHSKVLADAGLLPLLVRHLASSHSALVIPILRTTGNIIARSDELTDQFLAPTMSPPLIPILSSLLSSSHRAIRKEAAYVVSNIAGGPPRHTEQLVEHPGGVIEGLAEILRTSQFDIAREAAYALSNIGSNPKYMERLVGVKGLVAGFLALLSSPDSEVAHLALTFIEMVLTFHPEGPSIIQQENGIEKMESLQFHKNQELYVLANHLIDKYFGEDYEDSESIPTEEEQKIEYPPWRTRQL